MLYLRQSTAAQAVLIGPFVDSTDGNTAETGLTISNTDIRLSKNGGNMVAKNSGGGTHDEIGYYTITLDATDTNTVGRLQLCVHETGALPVWHEFQVLEEDAYDFIYASGATPDTDVAAILTDTGTTLENHLTDIKGTSFVKDTHSLIDIEGYVDLIDDGTSGLAKIATDVAATLVDTAVIGALGAGLTGIPWNSAWDAEVQSEVTDGLNAYDPPTKTEMDTAHGLLATEAKQDIIDGIVDNILVDTAVIGALGAGLTGIPWNSAWDTEVESECNDALVALHLDHLLAADYDPASKPGVATALMNELIENDGGVSRYTANALEQAPSGGASAATIADAVWDEAQADHVAAGNFGIIASEIADILTDTGTTLDGKIDTIDTNVDAVLIDTGTTLDGAISTIDSNVDAILVDTGITLQAELDGIQADTEDIQSRIPAALVSGRMSADAVALSGSTAAADNLEASAEIIITGAAAAGTLSTTQMSTDLAEATDDHYNGRIIVWTSGVLIGQATDITDYVGTNGVLTFTAVTEAPSASDTFVIL